jgi:hypothetical protein
MEAGMEQINAVLEREEELLETLLYKLVATRLLLEAGETRFLSRATREVERIRTRTCEVDLIRATTVARYDPRPGLTLRAIAAGATEPWPVILRDHHDRLATVVAEIEVAAHRNAAEARTGLDSLRRARVVAAVPGGDWHGGGQADLDRLARGAAFESVLGTAARLRMPDLIDFLR